MNWACSPRVLAQDVQALLAHLDIETLHSLGGPAGYELLELGQPRLLSLTTFGTTAELHSSRLTYCTVVASIRLLGAKDVAASSPWTKPGIPLIWSSRKRSTISWKPSWRNGWLDYRQL